jgi:HEAT repeat protein
LNVSPAHDAETLGLLEAGTKDADPDVANASRLALGNALRTVEGTGGSSPSSANALATAYADASSGEERTDALSAIGNSGDRSLLPLVEHALSDPNPQVQETATFALRFMSPAADSMLGNALSSPFPEVRAAAVRALQLRSIETVRPSIEHAFSVEPLADLKRALGRLLARAS